MLNNVKRIGILTGGGDCPGLNAVIRGAVKSADRLGYDMVGFLNGFEGLVDPVAYKPLNRRNTSGILHQGGTILGSTNKGRFTARAGISKRLQIPSELLAGAQTTIEQLGLCGLICVGGDGSLSIAQQLHEYGLPVVGVPKTIDNDLSATAFTFGFDSAVACATDALDRLHTTAASHGRTMVLEVMGRHAGWIALHAGIAGGGDVILIPEIPWSFENVCEKILERESRGKNFTLVVVAEGAETPDGGLITKEGDQNDRQTRLGGIGNLVGEEITKRLLRETRVVVLGHLQRGGAADHIRSRVGHPIRRPCRQAGCAGPFRQDGLLPSAVDPRSADHRRGEGFVARRSPGRRRAGRPSAGHQLRRHAAEPTSLPPVCSAGGASRAHRSAGR